MIHPFISIIILLGFGKACRKTIQFFLFPSNTFVIVGVWGIFHTSFHWPSMVSLNPVNDFPYIPDFQFGLRQLKSDKEEEFFTAGVNSADYLVK